MSFKFFCNQCLSFPSDDKRKYWAASCMHIFCEMCFTDKEFCKLCDKPCRSLPINRDIPNDVRVFLEPHSVETTAGTLEKVWNFQSRQTLLFNAHKKEQKKRYSTLKEEFFRHQDGMKELDEALRQEYFVIDKLKAAYASGTFAPNLLTMSPKTSISPSSSIKQAPNSGTGSPVSKMSRSSSADSIGSRSSFGFGSNASTLRRPSTSRPSSSNSLPESQQEQHRENREKSSIIHQTLLNMQKVSNDRYQAHRREQMRKMNWK